MNGVPKTLGAESRRRGGAGPAITSRREREMDAGVRSLALGAAAALTVVSRIHESKVTASSRACPDNLYTARNIGVFDYDQDGLLDLFIVIQTARVILWPSGVR